MECAARAAHTFPSLTFCLSVRPTTPFQALPTASTQHSILQPQPYRKPWAWEAAGRAWQAQPLALGQGLCLGLPHAARPLLRPHWGASVWPLTQCKVGHGRPLHCVHVRTHAHAHTHAHAPAPSTTPPPTATHRHLCLLAFRERDTTPLSLSSVHRHGRRHGPAPAPASFDHTYRAL